MDHQEETKKRWCQNFEPGWVRRTLLVFDIDAKTKYSGGIRGIIELCILQKVLEQVGHHIPIQELFDLAVGTSTGESTFHCLQNLEKKTDKPSPTGGIIALGLFKMDWSVETAITKFKSLSNEAFSSRQLLAVPGFKNVAQIFCSYRYESAGIENALVHAFGRDPLFGQVKKALSERVKVGVVAAVRENNRPYLFSNYSRNPTHGKCLDSKR